MGLFGVWQLLPKLPALSSADPTALQVACLPGLAAVAFILAPRASRGLTSRRDLWWAVVTGSAGALGTLAVLLAFAAGGPGSVVTPLFTMYPLATALGGWWLFKERFAPAQRLGLVLFALAIFAFGGELTQGPGTRAVLAPWLAYTAGAFVIFGASGLTMKLATRNNSSAAALLGWGLGYAAVTVILAVARRPPFPASGAFWALATTYGLLLGAGLITSFEAYAHGRASVVTAVTALYPAVTVALAVTLPAIAEPFGPRKAVAVVLALLAGGALALEGTDATQGAPNRGLEPPGERSS